MLRQLVAGCLDDNALELFTTNEAIAVPVKLVESLSDALTLETAQHLTELRVVERVTVLLVADIDLGPIRFPVEGKVVGALVELVESAEIVILDSAIALDVEQTEGDLVFGIGLAEEVLEHSPVS